MSRIQGALMMIVDTRAEIHVVCARHRNMLDDNISLNEAHGPRGIWLELHCLTHTHRRVHLAVQVRWPARQRGQNNRNGVRSGSVAGDELLC